MNDQNFQELIDKWLVNAITDTEKSQLFQMIRRSEYLPELEKIMDQQLATGEFDGAGNDELRKLIFQRLKEDRQAVVIPIRKQRKFWTRIAVAASIVLLLAAGYWFFENQKGKGKTEKEIAVVYDVKAPETNRAMITLATGQRIYLDSAANGQLATEGNTVVTKKGDGKIEYSQESGAGSKEIQYNTLINPRGSKVIDITLSDGSQVWLNAGSSVTYPVAFVGSDRKVSINGEAYFEVAHDATKPFVVSKGEINVQVLGTHFNVNAYDDEPTVRVTLLEGSVKVNKGSNSLMIKPGEQAVLSRDPVATGSRLITKGLVDPDEVMAWKNGLFDFENDDLPTVMRQLSRWYDADVEYVGEIPVKSISGQISRNVNISGVINMIEQTGRVQFKIEGKKVIVKAK